MAVIFEPDKLLSGSDIFTEQESKGFLVGYGFALGLWRVMPDQFWVIFTCEGFFSPGFFPRASRGGENSSNSDSASPTFLSIRLMARGLISTLMSLKPGMMILWVTNYDIKRLMESGLDFDKLPMLNDIERPDLDSDSKK